MIVFVMRDVMRELNNTFIIYFITFWAIRDVMKDVGMTVFVMREVMRELDNTFITNFITFWASVGGGSQRQPGGSGVKTLSL